MLRTSLAAIALAVVGICFGSIPAPAPAATHIVNQVGFAFEPNDITIDVGDTVEWLWSAGTHTVTEGTSPGDTIPAPDFDEPLTMENPLVSITFDVAGDVLYYCEPHFLFDMVGIVRVEGPTPTPELVELSSFSRIKELYR